MFDYGEVCPVSKAASILCERWTLQIIREMLMGASRFSEFQKYLPKLSPTLLNSRLRTLEEEGIIMRKKVPGKSGYEYQLTPSGNGLKPLLKEFGKWGMEWAFDFAEEDELNPSVIIRDFAVALDPDYLPSGESVIQFTVNDGEKKPSKQFILIRHGKAQNCDENIGYEVDVYLTAELKTFYEIWFGNISVNKACNNNLLTVVGPTDYTKHLSKWLRTSQFADYNNKNADNE